MATNDSVAIRKRSQIAKANRTMFLWVAGASVVVGFAAVVIIFLVQLTVFNGKIVMEKEKTVSTLDKNLKAVDPENENSLANNIRKYESDERLLSVSTDPSAGYALQSILDALPAQPNSLALGGSLQYRLLNMDGVYIEGLQVDDVTDGGSTSDVTATVATDDTNASGAEQLGFRFTIVGSAANLQQVLQRLESSIRTINITTMTLESRGNGTEAISVQGVAYYQPERIVQLKDKTVKP